MNSNDLMLDHIVPPAELRRELVRLRTAERKELSLPRRKHGTVI